jgi:LPXTG-motif cell wall-anchored protein
MKSIGGWLMIGLGSVLVLGQLSSGVDVGTGPTPCGTIQLGVAVTCPTGDLTVTKTVVGTGTAPVGGWTVTIGSTNCAAMLAGRQDLVLTIPAAGGSGTVSGLYVFTDVTSQTACSYTVTETPVGGWTPAFTPGGPYTLVANQATAVALRNTADTTTTTSTTTTTTTTTTAPTTTASTTTSPATTTVAPSTEAPTTATPSTTTSPATTSAAEAGTPTTLVALPKTGSGSTRPMTYIGLVLVLLGAVIVVNSRRGSKHPTS